MVLTNKRHSPRHNFYNLFVKKTNLTDTNFKRKIEKIPPHEKFVEFCRRVFFQPSWHHQDDEQTHVAYNGLRVLNEECFPP
jgi:hypothetical protein